MKLTPAYRMLWLLAPLAPFALLADYHFLPWQISALFFLAVFLLATLDALALKHFQPRLELRRELKKNVPQGVWSGLTLTVKNLDDRPFTAHCGERNPDAGTMRLAPSEFELNLKPGCEAELKYRLLPSQRGVYSFFGLDALLRSPWGLWYEQRLLACPQEICVAPNFRELQRFTLLANSSCLMRMGIRCLAREGGGMELHELREYSPGDSLQRIDWKATAKRQMLITRAYQDEREQQIVLVLDCSRRMRHMERGCSLFDQALNSALLLAHVAARQGDSVGLMAVGDEIRWYPPVKKARATTRFLQAGAELFPENAAVDYRELARELELRLKRRSLLIVLTNSRAEEYEELALLARQLGRRHLLVLADLLESAVAEALSREIRTPAEALRYQAILAYKRARRRHMLQLRQLGCLALDLTAPELPPALVNTYLDLKKRRRL